MRQRILGYAFGTMLFALCFSADAQQAKLADLGLGKLSRVR